MADADGKIVYKITVDDDGAILAAERAGEKVKDKFDKGAGTGSLFEKVMTGAAHRIGAAFVDMAARAVDGVKEITKAGIEFNAKMEQYQTAFTTLLGSATEAEQVMAQIRKDAASTPFDVDGLTQANQLLISAGVAADDAREDVLNLANAIAATGGGSDELSRMAANLQQIKNTGKASAVDIKQFALAGINIYGLLADSMGVTTEQAAEMEVTYEQLTAALANAAAEGGMYAGALEAQAATFNGQMSNLKDNAEQLAGTLTQDLFATLAETALPMVNEWVGTLLEAAQTGGIEGAMQAGGEILSALIDKLITELPSMIETGGTVLLSFLSGIVNNLPQLIVAGSNMIVQIMTGLIRLMPQLLTLAWDLVKAIFTTLYDTDWSSVGANIVNGIWAGIVSLWDWLVGNVRDAVNRLWTQAKAALGIASPSKKFKYIGEMSVEGTSQGFEDGEGELIRTVKTVYGGMLNAAEDSINTPILGYAPGMSGLYDLERSVSFNLAATGTTGAREIIVPLYINDREFARATAWDMGEQLAWRDV